MEYIKAIYFQRHLFKFENVWTERKFPRRNVNDLNGFVCCLFCFIPFGLIKAVSMTLLHLLVLVPLMSITSIILFLYQLIMIYICTLSTALLGPKIKLILFFTIWMLYSIFIILYFICAILLCILFSIYASFKVTLSDNYYILGGYMDTIKVLFINIKIYIMNNTTHFHQYCIEIKRAIINPEEGEEIWDISLISWCNTLMSLIMTLCSVVFIMSFVLVLIMLYFIPFSLHLINVYCFRFLKYFCCTFTIDQPCLALIAFPFVLLCVVFIPILAILYLVLYVWLYSAFFNKAIIMEAYVDNPFECIQSCNYILNTILLYNHTLLRYSFQSCWKCNCCYKLEKPEDEGYDDDIKIKKKTKNDTNKHYNPFEIKFRELFAILGDTKNNKDLVKLCGKHVQINKEKEIKHQERKKKEKETYRRQQINIELWSSPKTNTSHKRVSSDSSLMKQNGKMSQIEKKHKYNEMDTNAIEEEGITLSNDDELDILMSPTDSDSDFDREFSYPRGI